MQTVVELIEADLDHEAGGEDLDFITEHLTEADVFAKYGLAEKAAGHLRAIIERAPKHLVAHEKLYRVLLDESDLDNARVAANQYIAILQDKGDITAVETVRDDFMMRGHTLEIAAPRAAATRTPTIERPIERPAPPPAPPPVVAVEEELSFDIDSGMEELDLDAATPLEEPAALSFESPSSPLGFEELGPLLEPEPEGLSFETPAGEGFSFDAPTEEPSVFEMEMPSFASAPSPEELRELDFYIEQEILEEARKKLEALASRFPGNQDLELRSALLKVAPAPATPPSPPPRATPFAPPVLSRDEIESELLSALPDDDDDFPAAAPPPPRVAAPPLPAPVVHEENLFADEDDFFDLAAELESELEEESEEVSLSEEEQSLEEIFKEFKKGVEQQLDSEDYDTHYNLGIAYKEMGLIDEAIGEFQLASKDPKRAVECASMLGLCFLEKGMPQLAIKWYRKGLEMPEISEEEHIGLLYDLGSAYMEVGDTDNAQKAFLEVYGMNSNYRDIVNRIKQLEDARK